MTVIQFRCQKNIMTTWEAMLTIYSEFIRAPGMAELSIFGVTFIRILEMVMTDLMPFLRKSKMKKILKIWWQIWSLSGQLFMARHSLSSRLLTPSTSTRQQSESQSPTSMTEQRQWQINKNKISFFPKKYSKIPWPFTKL